MGRYIQIYSIVLKILNENALKHLDIKHLFFCSLLDVPS